MFWEVLEGIISKGFEHIRLILIHYFIACAAAACEKCATNGAVWRVSNMWCLIFSKHKLNMHKWHYLQRLLDDYTYSQSSLGELDLGEDFKDVKIRDHTCGDVIKKLYYSAGLEPVCIYCGADWPFTSEDHYLQYEACFICTVNGKDSLG